MSDQDAVLGAFLAALPQPALAIDGTERIVAANPEALALLGAHAAGMHYITLLRQPGLIDPIEATLGDGRPREAQYLGNDGARDTSYRVTCRAVPDVGHRSAGAVIVTFEDITDVAQAGQMRKDFIANVSHELRTPLTAIIGFIDTLSGPARGDAAASARFLDLMQAEAERMNRLLGDLMSLNQVETTERMRPTDRVDLGAAVEAAARSLRHLAAEAQVEIETDLPGHDVMIPADPDQIRQVLTNLLQNAIKYGGSGGRVILRMRHDGRDPALRAPGVRVSVTDFGPGIDPVHLPRLTERFYRADDHRSRALGGTGLGLAIVKHIVNRHRGRLRVHSELGAGATFTVILPAFARPGAHGTDP